MEIESEMRVIAGTARRLPLKTLPGMDTRPTTDRTKETLFNILQPVMGDCIFLDLFSGSGAIGIEALSRGSAATVFVENNPKAAACIKENLEFTHLADKAEIMKNDVLTALRMLEGREPFDCIFMDPPYGREIEKEVIQYLSDSSLAGSKTIIVVEADLKTNFDYLEENGFVLDKYKKYKTNAHIFIKKRQ